MTSIWSGEPVLRSSWTARWGRLRSRRIDSEGNIEAIRLERRGDAFVASVRAKGGTTWIETDRVNLSAFSDTYHGGIAATAGAPDSGGEFEAIEASVCSVRLESLEGEAPVPFLRGDCNDDGAVDLADALCVLGFLFLGREVGCVAVTNVNGDGVIDVTDAVAVLSYLLLGGAPPAGPFPACGEAMPPAGQMIRCVTPPAHCG
jgi:hypothetical protein